ncbi:unnamed protein product [Caenorhabditis sp. 36 PRJEB53466]|nr:unnamed protein product [Caenorhabditis sp. 36 PRJEB53466]
MSSSLCEKRIENIVAQVTDGSGQFYVVRTEPIPSKTCFDVTLKTYGVPSVEHVVTVAIPKNYPFSPPTITAKSDRKMQFKFLKKNRYRPSMSISEVLVEACHVLSRQDLVARRPILPPIRPPVQQPAKIQKSSPKSE